ncbi:DUF898 domain-containing protein [Oxalobacteraceae bacterium CAVE-383]|nr:DUF898 domain-containing protein [Oxalobacteraceae bacterium CAVE-383]
MDNAPPFDTFIATRNPSGLPGFEPQPFTFSGRGSEYFRIWIVNLLLTLVTLGIYSAWAKVRRTRYLYDNTSVAGSSFDYHGNPIAILKGRIIAIVLIALYHLGPRISAWAGILVFVGAAAILPWLIWKSLQFKLHNSSYRGIRFGLRGSLGSAYKVFLLYPVLTAFSLYLLMPFAHQRIKRFQHNASRFGNASFSFHATVGSFYKLYLTSWGLAIGGIIAMFILFNSTMFSAASHASANGNIMRGTYITIFAIDLMLLVILPIYLSLLQNLVWNNTRLGEHRFESRMEWPRAVWILLSNLFLIAVTLGLFVPFATIRWQRFRIEAMVLLPASDLGEFAADSEASGSVTGEGVTDLMDFGLSL